MPKGVDETAGCKVTTNIQNCTRGNQGEPLCYHNSKEKMCGTKCGGTLVHYTKTIVTIFKLHIMYFYNSSEKFLEKSNCSFHGAHYKDMKNYCILDSRIAVSVSFFTT